MSQLTDYTEIDWNKIFYYDENSPSGLRWLVNRGKCHVGDIAGSKSYTDTTKTKPKCWEARYCGKLYKVHRIIFCILFPTIFKNEFVINHIDNNPFNNKIENLETVCQSENMRKCKSHTGKSLQINNRSGINGISVLTKNGTDYGYTASCREYPSGKQLIETFSISKYGDELALLLAKTWRDYHIKFFNKKGANYAGIYE